MVNNSPIFTGLGRTAILDVQITQACQLNCAMCINSKAVKGHVDFIALKRFLESSLSFKHMTIPGIAIGGGEPLLFKEAVFDLIEFAKSRGIYTSLNTNGLLLAPEDVQRIAPKLDMLHLPIDASMEDVQAVMRDVGHLLPHNLWIAKLFSESGFKGTIKIATVVSSVNAHSVVGIAKLLENIRVDIWRLYQFRPHGMGASVFDSYGISEQLFSTVVEDVKRVAPRGCIVAPNYTERYVDKVFVLPSGDLAIGNSAPLSMNICAFDEAIFVKQHEAHLRRLELYIRERLVCYGKMP